MLQLLLVFALHCNAIAIPAMDDQTHLITFMSIRDGLPCLHAVMHGFHFRGRGSLPGLFPETDRLPQ